MHYLSEAHILLFLLQVLVLLGVAKTLSVLCESVSIPSIAGEIFAGIVLGPTIFGRVAPDAHMWLFPDDKSQFIMLETVSWLGVFFLLLSSGFHVNINQAIKSGKSAFLIGIIGVVVPIAIGIPVFMAFDEKYWGAEATGLIFPLFLAVAGSITAISVVARALGDLKISDTLESSLALSACAINDIFGWFLFSIVMSLISAQTMDVNELLFTAIGIVAFVTIAMTYGGRIMDFALEYIHATRLSKPIATQSLIVSAGLLCGAITQGLGIHAILGFFIAGIMVANSKRVSEDMRNSISVTLHAIFVPLFFATLGLKIDFIIGLELWPTLVFSAIAIFGKFFGAWLGAIMGKVPQKTSVLMGYIFIPGGAMEIVVATLALELQLIGQTIYVAIVFAALLSSILAGPLIGMQARRMNLMKE